MNLIIAASSGGITDILRETAETFGWNWKLFLSQVISFCIVAYLLQRFAYKPILALLEERRSKIEEGQLNAEKIRKELAEADDLRQKQLPIPAEGVGCFAQDIGNASGGGGNYHIHNLNFGRKTDCLPWFN